jgi:hypothetical protein
MYLHAARAIGGSNITTARLLPHSQTLCKSRAFEDFSFKVSLTGILMSEDVEIEFETPLEEEAESTEIPTQTRTVYTDGADPEVASLHGKAKRGKLVVQPDFQRHFVWDSKKASRLIESALLSIAVAAGICGGFVFLYTIYIVAVGFSDWQAVLRDHFAAIIGLPGAASLAFALVVFLRQTDGPIEFEGLGFKFKGAAGQVAMWIACFLAIAGAIKLCW